MIEVIYLLLSALSELWENLHGKWNLNILIIIFICLSFSKGSEKLNNHTNFWPIKELMNLLKEIPTNCYLFCLNSLFQSRKPFQQKMLTLCVQLWKKFKNLSLLEKWLVKPLFLTIVKFFQSLICLKTRDSTLEIKSIILREKMKTYQIWFNKLCKFCKRMVEKMPTSTSNTWFQHMKVACFEINLCF